MVLGNVPAGNVSPGDSCGSSYKMLPLPKAVLLRAVSPIPVSQAADVAVLVPILEDSNWMDKAGPATSQDPLQHQLRILL